MAELNIWKGLSESKLNSIELINLKIELLLAILLESSWKVYKIPTKRYFIFYFLVIHDLSLEKKDFCHCVENLYYFWKNIFSSKVGFHALWNLRFQIMPLLFPFIWFLN